MTDFANLVIDAPGDPTLLDLLKFVLGINPSDSSRDAELSMYLEMAGQAAEKYIDNIIEKRTVTEQFSHRMTPISLRFWPYHGDLVVIEDGEDMTANWESMSDDGIAWAVNGRCTYNRNKCFEQVAISYTAGFDPVPADLAYAMVLGGVAYEGGGGGVVKKETVVGVGSIEYATSEDVAHEGTRVGMMPASAIGILDAYRRYHA